uniref:Uncharacterized protein n=1 Tax=Heterorhabditis bacteriophora TaxID=37862 RepID=A0A1I7WAK5_HETBA
MFYYYNIFSSSLSMNWLYSHKIWPFKLPLLISYFGT